MGSITREEETGLVWNAVVIVLQTMDHVVRLVTRHSCSHVMQGDHRQRGSTGARLKLLVWKHLILLHEHWCNVYRPRPLLCVHRLPWSCRSCSWPQNRLPCCPRSSGRASSSSKSRFRRLQERLDGQPRKNLRRFSGEATFLQEVESRS